MTDLGRKILKLIAEKYRETGKTDMLIIQFPFEDRNSRDEVGNELKAEGYLSKFDTFGRADFRCDITPMMVEMIEENTLEEIAEEECLAETDLSEISNEESDNEAVTELVSNSVTDDPKKKKKTISIIVALLLVFMLIFVMIPKQTKLEKARDAAFQLLHHMSNHTVGNAPNVLAYTVDENEKVDSIKIDTNPLDLSEEVLDHLSSMSLNEFVGWASLRFDAETTITLKDVVYETMPHSFEAIKLVNEELGFGSAVYEMMLRTSSSMGRQTQENDKYCVSWTYHPDRGLEIMYYEK